MSNIVVQAEWMLIPAFSAITGYTEKAIRRKIEDGVWRQGQHYCKAPDGRLTMNLQEYYKWVQQTE
ncbi:excisionase [Janthinobacterium sp. B9-8]|uniref:excisionase n=1 Tax=Janthinobacterium sp. B9-8 TaxID=1236179 RepID=UPI00061D211E|nr:excisionase [Janthinobacterium sp. B9-8]AMC34794.1 excisionase [Janthinobacterium sp. B9-8]